MRPLSALPSIPEGRITVADRRAIREEIQRHMHAALEGSDLRLSNIFVHVSRDMAAPKPGRCEWCGTTVAHGTHCAGCSVLSEEYAEDCRQDDIDNDASIYGED